jgi:hypothetical protein
MGQPTNAKYRDAPLSLVVRVLAQGEMAPGACYLWPGHKDADGYGTTGYSRDGLWTMLLVHRLVYVHLVDDPGVLPVDHTCHDPATCHVSPDECPHRRCMSPDHLKAVTHAVNVGRGGGLAAINAAKTHCDSGHEFTPENTHWRKSGGRRCRKCGSARMVAVRAAARAGNPPPVKSEAASRAAIRRWS